MILLLNAHKKIFPEKLNLYCFSENRKSSKTSYAQIRLASYPGPNCAFEFFIASCPTVSNPDYFGLTSPRTDIYVELNYDLPVRENYPVLMCYPPMVYESRWQQIIFAIEIYQYYGTDMQIQYINSAMTEIVDLLKIYEKKGFIKTENFAFVDFDDKTVSKIGINPMLELNSRNQPLALTDCLMKYRESAEFIIIADVDDILFPERKPFYNEFSFWSKVYSNFSAFMYYRSYAKIEVAETFEEFSFEKTIKSLKKIDVLDFGKTVYKTKNVEAAWIHWPPFKNRTTATVPPNKGRMLHVQVKNSTLYMVSEYLK
uniref:Glycosyltransferase family 92 protein n=1 Tax=Panagrolaimus davidi TaxID=227884 RepID=A0A914R1A4_9BILA